MSEYHQQSRLPDDPSPADVVLAVLCFVSQPEVRESYDGEPIATVPHAGCRFCGSDLRSQGEWCDAHIGIVRPARDDTRGRRRRRTRP